jgi:putative FmdB family regulatory protein
MPTYEYKCLDCQEKFEIFYKRSSDEHDVKCTKCNSEKIIKLISKTSFVLKNGGVGWAKDGYNK